LQQATNPPKTIIKNKTPTHELNEIRDNDETTTCDRSQLHLTEVGGRNSSRIPPFLGGSSPRYGLLSQHITKRDADPHTEKKKLQNHHHLKTKSHKLNFLFTTSTPTSSKRKQTERKMLLKLDTKSPILNTTISTLSFFFLLFLLISSYNKRENFNFNETKDPKPKQKKIISRVYYNKKANKRAWKEF
jgi:hypothetical protein